MPSPLTAYLAGVASVSVALAVGFGGALVVANTVMTDEPTPPSKMERFAKHEPRPQAQTATKDTAFPVQASPVLVVPNPPAQTDQTKTAAAEDVGQEAASPPVAASRDSARETNKKVEEERKPPASRQSQKHERRVDRKRQVAATRWDKKRKASASVDVPTKAMIRQAPKDAGYEDDDDDDLMISSAGRLSFVDE